MGVKFISAENIGTSLQKMGRFQRGRKAADRNASKYRRKPVGVIGKNVRDRVKRLSISQSAHGSKGDGGWTRDNG